VESLVLGHDAGSGTTTLSWLPPLDPGASAVAYEILRSTNPRNFLTSTSCVTDGDPTDTTATDLEVPGVEGFNYLVRAVNGCPSGAGLVGRSSTNTPIAGRPCP
jgi:hypothetical protein